ncbi:hypothetical protein ACLB2K_022679 [Fragaria x ananassa]
MGSVVLVQRFHQVLRAVQKRTSAQPLKCGRLSVFHRPAPTTPFLLAGAHQTLILSFLLLVDSPVASFLPSLIGLEASSEVATQSFNPDLSDLLLHSYVVLDVSAILR